MLDAGTRRPAQGCDGARARLDVIPTASAAGRQPDAVSRLPQRECPGIVQEECRGGDGIEDSRARADSSSGPMYHAIPQVLVVEPDAALQAALAAWLEGAGYDCVPVSDADEALAIAEDDEADVALVSSHVAAWSAPHLAVALQSRDRDLPVIVVRGAGEPRRSSLRSRAGAVEEIPAPLTRGAVMHAIVRALEWRDATADERRGFQELERAIGAQAALVRDACLSEPCSAPGLTAALVRFLDRKVPGAGGHAERVGALSLQLGSAIGMSVDALGVLGHAASLHDFGTALLPQQLRRPEASLGRLERVLARRHPEIVCDLLAHVPMLAEAAQLVLCGHERFDGAGFPRGLAGLEIPMGARIIALASAIDSLESGASDGAARSSSAVGSELVRRAGSEFDPDLVRAWLRLAEQHAVARPH
jgi:response regulator RpfG family c-di-GMP phosphodiesterase